VSAEGYSCVEACFVLVGWFGEGTGGKEGLTGNVLGEELAALGEAFWATWSFGIPEGFDDDVVVWAWSDGDVASGCVAYFGTVAQEQDIHVGYYCRVFGRVCDIDFRFQRKSRFRSLQYS